MQDLLLLSKDTPIGKVANGNFGVLDSKRLPLFLKRTGDIQTWLESRAIDNHRTNSRILKRALRLESKDDFTTVMAVNAVTITDNYWVKPIDDEATKYDDVRFKGNMFDMLALTGDVNSFDQPPSKTPELTNIGSFEKCWRLEDGKWWMYKAGRNEELFSELMAYYVGKTLGFPMAEYEVADKFIKNCDFTDSASTNFEPAASIIGDTSDYIKIYEALKQISETIAEQYVLMCYFDGLIYNMDRHEYNFGIIRNSDTGEIISIAPFFDHNIALISRGYPINAPNDALIKDFTTLIHHTNKPIRIRKIAAREFLAIANEVPFKPPATEDVTHPREFIAKYIESRQSALGAQNQDLLHFFTPKSKEVVR
ncbi:MAG: hypothetical protein FWD05_13140 [Oscillospiraceae bacterium]|nr:hypothetical protein [Oscillospiraceae bacterium]